MANKILFSKQSTDGKKLTLFHSLAHFISSAVTEKARNHFLLTVVRPNVQVSCA